MKNSPVPGSKLLGKKIKKVFRKPREGYARATRGSGRDRELELGSTISIPYSGILNPGIHYDWSVLQFPSTFTSITCLRTRKAKQTWRACETLLHHRFCHLDTRNGFCGSRRTEVIKKMLTSSPLLSFQRFSLDIFFPS